ncbi:SDR family oxidoreductase [Nocardioides sp. T2.26MG-1]|uniref:SDR family oxidoreductase n=1 Tax=Nocardioides sp. T2.26MG-1 TaxID=3041166 RepID=UPI0024778C58|nr:SDR family oxidoreductase [Nocardioides sp. T2.26MG-1]CAI9405498.1 3-phenylpropionate-dihydrodiol/cinnamic acid-dihydrodiol dehydrogenase [Nocardioides sp. T2.26MG-1]
MTRQISGMSIIVTGGARGIGKATVERFARQGASVAVGDLDPELAAETTGAYGDRVVAARLDVTAPASWREFLAEVAHLGPWDVLVNNAGIMPLGSVLKEPDEVTRAIFDVNVHGPINGTKAVAPGMVERGHGHIVNVASAVGRLAVADGASYSASKFAVVGFSEATRAELGPLGIDVSVVLPTVVQTELSAGVPAAKGVPPVTADDVATVIESVVRKPRAEVWVPRWVQGPTKTIQALPRRVQDALARMNGAADVLHKADPAARAAYEERARRNAE